MRKELYTEYSDFYCEYEQIDNTKKDDDMKEMLAIIRRMDTVLQIICASVIGILITILTW